jgi:hypothetical protein
VGWTIFYQGLPLGAIVTIVVPAGLGAVLGQEMDLKSGDWVETAKGERGKVVHTSRLTVFVAFPREGQSDIVSAFLEI